MNLKKLLSTVCIGCLLLVVSACGGGEETGGDTANKNLWGDDMPSSVPLYEGGTLAEQDIRHNGVDTWALNFTDTKINAALGYSLKLKETGWTNIDVKNLSNGKKLSAKRGKFTLRLTTYDETKESRLEVTK